ncbi:MAG: type I secretion system permease/ATPase [Pseudomonadota bacterium]
MLKSGDAPPRGEQQKTDAKAALPEWFRIPLWSRSILLFSLVANVLLLAPSLHLLQVYDRVLASGSIETLIYITLIAVFALLFYAVAEVIRTRIAVRVSNFFMVKNSQRIFNFLVHDRRNGLDANGVLRDLNTIRAFLAGRQFIGLHDLPFFPIFLVFLFLLHFTLGIVALFGIGAMIAIALVNFRSTLEMRKVSESAKNEASGFSMAVLRRTDEIRAMGLLPSIMQRWGAKTAMSLNTADDVTERTAFFYGLSRMVRQTLQIFVMAWGAGLVLQGEMSGGMIFAASLLLGKTLMPIEQVIGGWDGLVAFRDAYHSVMRAAAHTRPIAATELPEPKGFLSVENLVFHPNADDGHKPIVDDVSFKLQPGEILAVLGPSGAGKSTISRLVVGAMAPTSGVIRLDDFDVNQWTDEQRGAAIGYVPQDIVLFPGTIAENIARLEPRPSDEAIIGAAQKAGVHEMIAALPDGYGSKIGNGAAPLSGGQRQRIALARAFYSSPKVLVLDEPNAHLDTHGEELLLSSLRAARDRGVAILVVSQRRSIMKIADRAMIVVDGKVQSIGAIPGNDSPARAAIEEQASQRAHGLPAKAPAAPNTIVAAAAQQKAPLKPAVQGVEQAVTGPRKKLAPALTPPAARNPADSATQSNPDRQDDAWLSVFDKLAKRKQTEPAEEASASTADAKRMATVHKLAKRTRKGGGAA